MEDLQAALQSVLSDPQQMEQILAMANALGLHPPDGSGDSSEAAPEEAGSDEPGSAPVPDAPQMPALDPALLRILGGLSNAQGPEDRVLNALRPVLRDPTRIDRALRAAKLSRLAGQFLKGGPEHV